MRQLGSIFFGENWLWMVAPLAVCGVFAYWIDVRFIFVAFMTLLVLMPMILALLYIYYGLSPDARWSIMEKTAILDEDGITLEFTDERMKTHAIRWDDVRYIIENNDVVMLMLKGSRYRCLMLPASAVDPDVAQAFRQFTAQAH